MITLKNISDIYHQRFVELLEQSHEQHRRSFPDFKIQASSLLSIKTGGCPEDCAYCPQSAHYQTGIAKHKLMTVAEVKETAQKAKQSGASRFCMGAAWRSVKDGPEFDQVIEMVREVKKQNLEVCCTLGMLSESQAQRLKEAGLDFYNHNIDTSRSYYEKIISTRTYDDRLQTLQNVRNSGLSVCTGGILGLGESVQDRLEFIHQLVSLNPLPESLTINTLVEFAGTPLAQDQKLPASLDVFEIVRTIATLRILSPMSYIRLSAGRLNLSEEGQFLCFYAGANSIFFGEKLLTSPNPQPVEDQNLLHKTGYELQDTL